MSSEWRTAKLVDVAAKKRWALNGGPFGSKLSRKHYSESGVPVIRGTNLPADSKFSFEDFVYVSEEKADELRANNAHPGDLIFTQRGTIGQVGLIPLDSPIPRFVISQSQMKLTVDPQQADAQFLYYFFSAADTVQKIQNLAFAAGVPHINLDILRKFETPVPPLPVQRRIAGILSAYDELMENSQRRIRLLEAMARALYREWFVHFRFPGHEKHPRVASPLGDIPQGWEVKKLGEMFEFIGGSQPPKIEHIHEQRPGYVRFIQNRDYGSSSHLTYIAESRRNKLCERLDIMVDKYGEPGKTRFGLAGAYNVALAKLLPHKPHHREWLRGLISEPDFNTYLAGASMAATRASLNSSHFTVDVAVPPAEVSEAFQTHVEPLLKLSLTHQDQIQNLRRTRDLLLPRLLSGQISLTTKENYVNV